MNKKSYDSENSNEAQQGFWISVSDLMAGLIFIFLIILTVFSIQFKKEQNSFIKAKAELQSPAKTRHHILLDLKKILSKNGLEVETYPEEGILRLTEQTLSFPAAKAFPNADKLGNLGKIAKALTMVLPCHSDYHRRVLSPEQNFDHPEWCQPIELESSYKCKTKFKGSIETVMIEGHTDAMAVKAGAGYRDNLALSAARATTVLRLLKLCDNRLGDLFNQKDQPIIGASGYSDLRPLIKHDPRNHRNRRIDVRLVMDLPDNALEPDDSLTKRKTISPPDRQL
ncbi:MAG: flagellar motor protein MotB [Oligoflexales bacterium]